ncbi:DUF3133 domain-containing protein [Cephalotus follicularis]|uniref:DUF3133 domain-containing protein n=1 Tax=Cephalotus follicularis TaxID=3775 RepID=A0A1Q3B691_CEPFO|nr:DUF3133 domain-containing protein [Cephalotus follicularis]
MAQESKVRLVRCPKCENLLQEPPDCSMYQCGGCGSVLRAKKKGSASDGVLKKFEGEKGKENYENLECLPEREGGSLGSISEIERGIGEIGNCRRNESDFGDRNVNLITSSSIEKEKKGVSVVRVQNVNPRLKQSSAEKEIGYANKHRESSRQQTDDWIHGEVDDMNMCMYGSVDSKMDKGIGNVSAQLKSFGSRPVMDRNGVEGYGYRGVYSNPRKAVERGGVLTYPDEGPSNYKQVSFYGYDEPMNNYGHHDDTCRAETLEHDRAVLLRKLDELKDQLSKSFDAAEKPSETFPVDRKMAPPDPRGGRVTYNVSTQPVGWDNYVPKPPNFSKPNPLMNTHGTEMPNVFSHPWHAPREISRYGDPLRLQSLCRPSNLHRRLPQRSTHDHFPRHYTGFSKDHSTSDPCEPFFHQHACSCPRCYYENWRLPPLAPPNVFGSGELLKNPINSNFYQYANPVTFGAHNCSSRADPAFGSKVPQLHTRCPGDFDPATGRRHPRRVVVAHGEKQLCHPIAGGAPFITCYNCFELLKLPGKIRMMQKDRQKLQCATCSTVISFKIENKSLNISVPTETRQATAEADNGLCELLHRSLANSQGCSNFGGTNYCSENFDDSGYNISSTDAKQNLLSEDQMLNLSKSKTRQGLSSSSSTFREQEESSDSVIEHRNVRNSAELPSNDNSSPTVSGSPFQEKFDSSSSDHALSRDGEGEKIKWTDQEKFIPRTNASRQDAAKDESVETKVEVSSSEYLDSSLSQDLMKVSREVGRPRINKGSESFLVGIIKKSFRDFSSSNHSVENQRPNVSVNGQPIPDRVVKKAEKRAGPILPGDYWYDYRGGFWGLMGQPCLGIIPPFVEEFNYPMPKNCAAGDTGIYVNGRELHQKDLDLLASRGIPTRRDKSYFIDISGRVLDEDTGEELDSLGKLAPTVQKAKRGFGMRAPKVAV